MTEREEYIENIDKSLGDIDARISEIKMGKRDLQDQENQQFNRQLISVQSQRDTVDSLLRSLRGSNEENWKELQKEVDEQMEELRREVNRLLA